MKNLKKIHQITKGNKMQTIIINSDELKDRLDPLYHKNIILLKKMDKRYPSIPLSKLILENPQYGANKRAIDGNSHSNIRYIRITDIDDFGNLKKDEWKTVKKIEPQFVLQENDLLFARSGATAGKTFIFKKNNPKSIFAGYLIRFKIDKTKVNPLYVFYYTQLNKYQLWKNTIRRPSGQPNINADEFGSFEIPMPPRKIQNQIVDKMELAHKEYKKLNEDAENKIKTILPKVSKNLKINISKLNKKNPKIFIKKSSGVGKRLDPRFYSLNSKSIDKLSKLPTERLGTLSLSIKSGITPKSKGDAYTTPDLGIPFIRSGDLSNYNLINFNDIIYIKKEIHEKKMKSSSIQKNDLLIAIVGATIGKTHIFTDSIEANINQAIARIRFDPNKINPFFVLYFLKTQLGQMELNRIKRPVARANINLQEVGDILIPIPKSKIQLQIVKLMKTAYDEEGKMKQKAKQSLKSNIIRITRKLN